MQSSYLTSNFPDDGTKLSSADKHPNRRLPTVLENIERIAAEITGGVPGDRASIVWPKANRNGVKPRARRQHRKPFITPQRLPPSRYEGLQYYVSGGPGKGEERRLVKHSGTRPYVKLVAVKDSVKSVATGRGNPHLNASRNPQSLHELGVVKDRKKWLSIPVHVIGN
jgi:hypothetical protein